MMTSRNVVILLLENYGVVVLSLDFPILLGASTYCTRVLEVLQCSVTSFLTILPPPMQPNPNSAHVQPIYPKFSIYLLQNTL